jgi:hypothetical protein
MMNPHVASLNEVDPSSQVNANVSARIPRAACGGTRCSSAAAT